MAFSPYLAQAIADWTADTKTVFPVPVTQLYLALHSGEDPLADPEATGGGYARTQIDLDAQGNSPESVILTNNKLISFNAGTSNLGLMPSWSIWSSVTGGNMLYHGTFDIPVDWRSGAILAIAQNIFAINIYTEDKVVS